MSGVLREVKANRHFGPKRVAARIKAKRIHNGAATGILSLTNDKTEIRQGAMNIYVGNLSLGVTKDELRQVFSIFGEVISVTIMDDNYIGSGEPRGYGYVQMASKFEGQAAVIALQEKDLRGQVIKVIEALPLSDSGHNKHLHSKKNRYFNLKTIQN